MINPSEISEVLRQQLENVNSKVSFEETGTVLDVGDGVAHVYGLDNVCANELVEFENGVTGVALNLEESNVGVILLDNVNKVTEGMSVKRTGEIASIPWAKVCWDVSSMCSASLSTAKDLSTASLYDCRLSARHREWFTASR